MNKERGKDTRSLHGSLAHSILQSLQLLQTRAGYIPLQDISVDLNPFDAHTLCLYLDHSSHLPSTLQESPTPALLLWQTTRRGLAWPSTRNDKCWDQLWLGNTQAVARSPSAVDGTFSALSSPPECRGGAADEHYCNGKGHRKPVVSSLVPLQCSEGSFPSAGTSSAKLDCHRSGCAGDKPSYNELDL